VTELPGGWVETRLEEIAETRLWKMLSAKARQGAHPRPYLRNKNVQWGRFDLSDLLVMDFDDEELERFRVLPGDLLVCEGGEVGRAAIWRGQIEDVGYQKALHRVRPAQGVLAEYLLYAFRWFAQTHALEAFITGSTINHLPQEDLRRLRIPLPPAAEQRRIVAAIEEHFSRLDAADESLRRAKNRTISLRNTIRSLAVAEGVERSLGELLDGIEAGKSFRCHGRPAAADEWGVIKVSAMTWGSFDDQENKAVMTEDRIDPRWEIKPGDLLLSRANTTEYVGASVLVRTCRGRLLLSDKSMRLLVRQDIDKAWLHLALNAPESRAQMSAVATGTSDSMRNISQEKVRAVRLRVPPVERQRRIVAEVERQLSVADAMAAEIDRALKRSAALRRSILERAFSGKLVPQDPSDEPASALLERIRAERAAAKTATGGRPRRRARMKAS